MPTDDVIVTPELAARLEFLRSARCACGKAADLTDGGADRCWPCWRAAVRAQMDKALPGHAPAVVIREEAHRPPGDLERS